MPEVIGKPRVITMDELKSRGKKRIEKLIERRYPEELSVGIKVEMEHTGDIEVARRIATDHLSENPEYYSKLIAAGLVDEPDALTEAKEQGIGKSLTWSGWKLQGRAKVNGMDISIENRKGSVRRGTDKDGHEWKTKMHYAYGYIRGTVGKDKDHLDCYLGPDKDSLKVFIVHQNDPVTGKYDEDKVMLQFSSAADAKAAYLKQYDRPDFFGSMDETDVEAFKELAFDKEHHGKKLVIAIKKSHEWANHKYIKKVGNKYFYTEDEIRNFKLQKKSDGFFYMDETKITNDPVKARQFEEKVREHKSVEKRVQVGDKVQIKTDHHGSIGRGVVAFVKELGDDYARVMDAAGRMFRVPTDALVFARSIKVNEKTITKSVFCVVRDLEKARKSPKLIAERRMVTRGGKTFQTVLWVLPGENDKPAQGGFDFDAEPEPKIDIAEELDGRLEIAFKQAKVKTKEGYFQALAQQLGGNIELQTEFAKRFNINASLPGTERKAHILSQITDEFNKQKAAHKGRAEAYRKATNDLKQHKTDSAMSAIEKMALEADDEMTRQIEERDATEPKPVNQSEAKETEQSRMSQSGTDASLSRSKHDVVFSKPYVGKTGAKLLGYEWPHIKVEGVDKRGEDKVFRYSDWSMADVNEMTGRKFVHKFIIEATDGNQTTLTAESAAVALGISEQSVRKNAVKLLEEEISKEKEKTRSMQEVEKVVSGKWYKSPAAALEDTDVPFQRSWIKHKEWGERKRKLLAEGYDGHYSGSEVIPYLKGPGGYQFTFVHGKHTDEELKKLGITTVRFQEKDVWDENGNDRLA